MPEVELAKAVQLLDLMLEFFADDGPLGRVVAMTTETAATALSARCCT